MKEIIKQGLLHYSNEIVFLIAITIVATTAYLFIVIVETILSNKRQY